MEANPSQSGTDTVADLAALERFVVENDDLLQLESLIGRFNIFDALGITHREISHSNFLDDEPDAELANGCKRCQWVQKMSMGAKDANGCKPGQKWVSP
jgi:hypothetical protein